MGKRNSGTQTENPIKGVIDASIAEVIARGTDGASDKAVLLAGIGYLAEMFHKANNRQRNRREMVVVGLERGGPWAIAVTLLGYLLQGLLGA